MTPRNLIQQKRRTKEKKWSSGYIRSYKLNICNSNMQYIDVIYDQVFVSMQMLLEKIEQTSIQMSLIEIRISNPENKTCCMLLNK